MNISGCYFTLILYILNKNLTGYPADESGYTAGYRLSKIGRISGTTYRIRTLNPQKQLFFIWYTRCKRNQQICRKANFYLQKDKNWILFTNCQRDYLDILVTRIRVYLIQKIL